MGDEFIVILNLDDKLYILEYKIDRIIDVIES